MAPDPTRNRLTGQGRLARISVPVGDFPPVLYRVLSRPEFAEAFVRKGRFRFGSLGTYRKTPDPARQDSTEGHADFAYRGKVPTAHVDADTLEVKRTTHSDGIIHASGVSTNPRYILCCSRPPGDDPANLPAHFGRYIVRINDPRRLAEEVSDWLAARGELDFPVEGAMVTYSRGQVIDREPEHVEYDRQSWAYKPPRYANEHEYRIVVTDDVPRRRSSGDHITIDLGHRLRYAEIIACPWS